MPLKPIVKYPNPILRAPALPVDPADPLLSTVIADLTDTLNSHHGVGIAAPQIGISQRIIIVDATRAKRPCPNHGPIVLLNPHITASSGHISFREGCLSIPDLVASVPRYNDITVSGITPSGSAITITPTGFEAAIFQHEIDHLDGILFIDRVRSARDIKHRPG